MTGQARWVDEQLAAFCEAEHRQLTGLLTLVTGDRHVAGELAGEDQTAIPATYILDREGRIAAWSVGQTNERELLAAIEHATG